MINIRHLKNAFTSSESGTVIVMVALMLPVIVGFIGLGIDVGVWFVERRSIQTVADAAAMSAIHEKYDNATNAEIFSLANADAVRNGYNAATDTIAINIPPMSGAFSGDSEHVEVIVNRQLSTYFSQLFMTSPPTATTRAVAGISNADLKACVLALATSGSDGVFMNSSTSVVNMEGCGVMSNSSDLDESVRIQNGTFNVDCIGAAGGIDDRGSLNMNCNRYQEKQAPLSDPYASVSVPSFSTCDYDEPGPNPYIPADGETISEGVYCDGLQFNAGTTVDMDDGTYIINRGDFRVNGGATLTGNNVTIILTDSSGSNEGTIVINGGGSVNITAPVSEDTSGSVTGDYTGILFYQDRTTANSSDHTAKINGGSEVNLGGAVYFPNNDIQFSGGSTTGSNGCLLMVAQHVTFTGDADINNDCDMYGGNPIDYGGRPSLVE